MTYSQFGQNSEAGGRSILELPRCLENIFGRKTNCILSQGLDVVEASGQLVQDETFYLAKLEAGKREVTQQQVMHTNIVVLRQN